MGTATFMIMGSICTRNCRFCAVEKGVPGKIDESEPSRLARAVKRLSLKYAIITSVDRDDLDDGGSAHFARCVQETRNTQALVEVLIPDFAGGDLEKVAASKPDVIGHNIETVRRLFPYVRDKKADYEKSLQVLRELKRHSGGIRTKSSVMLGMGESMEEIVETMHDLRDAGVDILTLGQYLQPSKEQLKVDRYVTPSDFAELGKRAEDMGFVCSSGPFVRSSFAAFEMYQKAQETEEHHLRS